MRNSTFDLLKFIGCFLVIYIHSCVKEGEIFLTFARIAVPIFFMITGFYYPTIVKNNKEKRYFVKIIRLTLFSTILYGFISFFYFHTFQLNTEKLIKWIGLNLIPFTGGHLWYLYALIYVLIFSKIFRKQLFGKATLPIILILMALNYYLSFNSDSISYRNFLFTGLPYFLSGYLVNRHSERIKNVALSNLGFLLLILVCCVLLFIEYTLYKEFDCFPVRDHYLMLYPLSLTVFCWAVRFPNLKRCTLFSLIGYKYSTSIYIYHLLFILFGDEFMWILKTHGYVDSVSHGFIYPCVIMFIVIVTIFLIRKVSHT